MHARAPEARDGRAAEEPQRRTRAIIWMEKCICVFVGISFPCTGAHDIRAYTHECTRTAHILRVYMRPAIKHPPRAR